MNDGSKEIKKKLLDVGLTSAEIGRRLGYSRGYISHLINRRFRSQKIEEQIAALISGEYNKQRSIVEEKNRYGRTHQE